MKKALKSVVALVFCFMMLASTAVFSSAIGAVTNLKATNVIYNSATLTWSAVKNADGYQVRPYVDKKYGTTVDNKKATTYTAKLTPGKSYYFYVRAYDKKLKNFKYVYEYSSWQKVAVKAVPAQVTGLKATQSGSTVKLSWTKVPSITGYVVQQYKSGKYTNIKTLSYKYTSLNVASQPYGSTQQFRVVAYVKYNSKNIYGSYSSAAKVTLKTSAPAAVKVKDVTASSGTVYWSKSTGATGYQLYRYSPAKKAYVKVATTTKTSYNVTGLNAATEYRFRVRSYVKYGSATNYSSWTADYKFSTLPKTISGIKLSDMTDTSCKISWTASKTTPSYQLYKYDYSTAKWTRVANTTKTSLSVTGLKPNSRYGFKVRGYVKIEGTYYYTAYSSILRPYTKMAAPVLKSSYDAATNSFKFSWSAVSGAAQYTLERYNSATYVWEEIYKGKTRSFTDENKITNAAPVYRLHAFNSAGEESMPAKGKTVSAPAITVTKDAYSATVTWGDIENNGTAIDRYEIRTIPVNYHKNVSSYWKIESTIKASDITGGDLDSYTYNLTPGAVNSFVIYVYEKNSAKPFIIGPIDVDAEDLTIDSSDKSKTSQILYFINAINSTKTEQGKLTANLVSSTKMDCDKLKIGGPLSAALLLEMPELTKYYSFKEDAFVLTGAKQISEFIGSLGENSEIGENEDFNATYVFDKGVTTKEDGTALELINFIEPASSNSRYSHFAYLYDYLNAASWKNGFSAVSTKKNTDGTYTFTATLKAEKYGTSGASKTNYHAGLSKTYDEFDFGDMLEGMGEVKSSTSVGATTITAKIDQNGKLLSYKLTSPVSSNVSASMQLDSEEKKEEDGLLEFAIAVSGTLDLNYTFKR